MWSLPLEGPQLIELCNLVHQVKGSCLIDPQPIAEFESATTAHHRIPELMTEPTESEFDYLFGGYDDDDDGVPAGGSQ